MLFFIHRFIVKVDDDIAVNYVNLLQTVLGFSDRENRLFGLVQYRLPVQRNPGWKWALSEREFPTPNFPNFLSGWAYVTTPKVAGKLLRASAKSDLLWIDDVWITGILAQMANVELVELNTYFTVYKEELQCCLAQKHRQCQFIAGPTDGDFDLLKRFYDRLLECWDFDRKRVLCRKSKIRNCNLTNPLFLPNTKGIGQVLL